MKPTKITRHQLNGNNMTDKEQYKKEAEDLVSRFLTHLPYVEGKPVMQTEEAKQCAVVACNWMKDKFAGDIHRKHYDDVIKAVRQL